MAPAVRVMLIVLVARLSVAATTGLRNLDEILTQGDSFLAEGQNQMAVAVYSEALDRLETLLPLEDNKNEEEDKYTPDLWPSNLDQQAISMIAVLRLYTNLGTALSVLEGSDSESNLLNQEAAVAAYQKGVQIYEAYRVAASTEVSKVAAQAAFYLGMTAQDLPYSHSPQQAVDAYQLALSIDPLHWSAYANLGAVYHDKLRLHDKAVAAYQKAYVLLTDPDEPTDPPPDPRPILSQLQYRIGLCLADDLPTENVGSSHSPSQHGGRKCALTDDPTRAVSCRELAAHAFALAAELDEDNEAAKHMLATLTADITVTRASNTYVTSLFDDYAANFEHSLVDELGYNGYARLRYAFDRAWKFGNGSSTVTSGVEVSVSHDPVTFDLVVDAGCGTGLVGEQFRNISGTLIGVDLSRAILDQAQQKRPGLYDDVRVGDVTEVFHEFESKISLIVAADSFIYFGDLDPLFESMFKGLSDGGYIAFTLENVDAAVERALKASKPDWKWQLTASGRFAHREEYVASVASRHSLALVRYEPLLDFRYERGVGVRGHIFIIQKRRLNGNASIHHEEL
jgi:predicted TPR repeat methyltransferase